MDLTEPMKDAILTVGDAYWRHGIRHNTARAVERRGLVARTHPTITDNYLIGLTQEGMDAYWTIREERAKED